MSNSPGADPATSPNPLMTTIAKKFVIALSGFGLVVFVILHLLGNLALYRGDQGIHFNEYAQRLQSFGGFLIVGEVGLFVVFLIHIGWTLYSKSRNLSARGKGYRVWRSKGGGTPSNLSSRNMAISGGLILAFVILHVVQFRFGPGIEAGYVAEVDGQQVRDLYRLVVETFRNPVWAAVYVVAMILLGLHLRHGIWSAFQSLGWTRPRTTRNLRFACMALGLLLAAGFLFIPVWIYFGVQT